MIIVIRMYDEEWVPLIHPQIKNIYEISNYGRVRNTKTGKILSQYTDKKCGYRHVPLHLVHEKRNKVFSVHRLVAMMFIPNPLNLPIVNHLNSDRTDNYFENLEWVTHQENVIHSINHGRWFVRGCALKKTYSNELVNEICSKISEGVSNAEIADTLLPDDIKRDRFIEYLGKLKRRQIRGDITKNYKW